MPLFLELTRKEPIEGYIKVMLAVNAIVSVTPLATGSHICLSNDESFDVTELYAEIRGRLDE